MELIQTVEDDVIRRAQGVFLWVRLIVTDLIDPLVDGEGPRKLLGLLSDIPGDGDLHALYRTTIARFRPSYRKEAYIMLQIACATPEPLSTTKSFQAVRYTLEGALAFEQSDPQEAHLKRRLTSRCKGLLEMQENFTQAVLEMQVQFLHQSVKDVLIKDGAFAAISENEDKLGDGHVFLVRFWIYKHLHECQIRPHALKFGGNRGMEVNNA